MSAAPDWLQLAGKSVLVAGVSNKKSIGWHIGTRLQEAGADVIWAVHGAARARELAVRSALGASRRRVLGMILFDVVKLVLPGVVVGLILTATLIRVDGERFGVPLSNVEYLAYVAGAVFAVLIAVVASLAPARRAASVQPMVAMRAE